MEAPGEKLLIKLWETLAEKGIGSLLKPWQIRREGKALAETQAEALVTLASAEKLAVDIKLGKYAPDNKTLLLEQGITKREEPVINADAIAMLASKFKYDEAIRTEINATKAVLIAESILAEDAEAPSEKNINQDWLYRWREYAGNVSSDELQIIWGKLLAGEIKSPGKFSLRTLEFVRNISTEEALKIENILSLVSNEFIYKVDDNAFKSFGVQFMDLLEMQNLGLITGVEAVGGLTATQHVTNTPNGHFVLKNNDTLVVVRSAAPKELSIPAYPLTSLGVQVYKLCKPNANLEFLRQVAKYIKALGFNVQLVIIDLSKTTKENYVALKIEDI